MGGKNFDVFPGKSRKSVENISHSWYFLTKFSITAEVGLHFQQLDFEVGSNYFIDLLVKPKTGRIYEI